MSAELSFLKKRVKESLNQISVLKITSHEEYVTHIIPKRILELKERLEEIKEITEPGKRIGKRIEEIINLGRGVMIFLELRFMGLSKFLEDCIPKEILQKFSMGMGISEDLAKEYLSGIAAMEFLNSLAIGDEKRRKRIERLSQDFIREKDERRRGILYSRILGSVLCHVLVTSK